jgi:lipopolysaccharide transport system ATP-binding protein
MTKPIIEVEGVSKFYRLGAIGATSLREEFQARWRQLRRRLSGAPAAAAPPDARDFWALRDVSFAVHPGEVIGVIGRNGAGKSTLLKILSRITEPTRGRVVMRGRVASLLEVGTGFHPDLTGRENIFLNGAILGMTRAEIARKFDEIVAFAEIGRFIDTPVKRYSSGMYVRLAFAVAAHLEPEILIIDEVLAVGDAAFQKKCLGKMEDVARHGRTVLFVSHNMGAVNALTERCVHLREGRLIATGPTREIVQAYLRGSQGGDAAGATEINTYRRDRHRETPVRIVGLGLEGHPVDAASLPRLELGAPFTVRIELEATTALSGARATLILKNAEGERAVVLTSWDEAAGLWLEPGRHVITAHVSGLALAPGPYYVDAGLDRSLHGTADDLILDFPLFVVVNSGQVTHWLDRPWGAVHCTAVAWKSAPAGK